jgi:hypothetical protein
MIYDYITKIPKESLFNYLAIFILVVGFVIIFVKPTFILVMGIIAGMLVVWWFNDKRGIKLSGINEELEYRLTVIRPKTNYFYTDPDIINFFYNIREFSEYNIDAYNRTVMSADNVLALHEDMRKGPFICADNIESAKKQMLLALNSLQSIIITTPNDDQIYEKYRPAILRDKHKKSMDILHLLLRRHIDDMYKLCNKQNKNIPINIYTKFPEPNYGPRMDDPKFNNLFNFFV